MTEKEETYRPKSPNLGGVVPPGRLDRLGSESQTPTAFGFPPGYSFSPRASYDASPYFSNQNSQASHYFASQPHSQTAVPQLSRTTSVPAIHSPRNQHYPPSASQPRRASPTFSTPSYSPQIFSQGPICDSPVTPRYPEMPRTRAKRPADDEDDDFNPNSAQSRPPLAPTMSNIPATQTDHSGEDLALTIDVKTKFPVARIKRIMQADEDVGKVAQATPTAVAKALELFMITLVLKGSNKAKSQNSKRVTAQHLKSALMADKEFDFLADCCADVPDEDRGGASKKGGRAKSEADDSDEEMVPAPAPAPAKKRKGSKRKGSEESD